MQTLKQKNKITIDVIIVTYNRASLFRKSLLSICNQTYKDFTIKVLDNGSTDNTKEVYDEIVNRYPDRKFEYKRLDKNHIDDYFTEELNKMITGDYVIVFHDDDLMHPRYVEQLMKIIPEHPEFVILGGKTKISENPEDLKWDEPTEKYIAGDMRDMVKWYFIGDTMSFPAICYQSHWYKNTKFRDDLYGNRGDFPFLMEIAEHGKVCRLEDRFLHYRLHKNQNTFIWPSMEKQKNLIKKMADILLSGDKEYQNAFFFGIENIFLPSGYIDYKIAVQEGWIHFSKKNARSKIYAIHLLKYLLYNILSLVIPSKKSRFKEKAKRHRLKSFTSIKISADKSNEIHIKECSYTKININISGKNNRLFIYSANGTGNINIDIAGDNNIIFIGRIVNRGLATIKAYCSNGEISIPETGIINNLSICNGYKEQYQKITGGKISIGSGTKFGSCFIFNPHSNTHINIGKQCMLSDDITIRNTDGHPIYNAETKECLNKVCAGNGIDIGNHVWIGLGASILKNTKIPDASIVGSEAVITKQFSESNTAIAGNPAKIVKRNVIWTAENNDFFSPAENTEQ